MESGCTLLGEDFGWYVQVFLAVSALLTLWYKRYIEATKRPLLVWAFDASKQAYAAVLQHTVNL